MKNKKEIRNTKYRIDTSYENNKFSNQKNHIKNKNSNAISKPISKNNNNNQIYQNIHKSNIIKKNNDEIRNINYNKINLINAHKKQSNNRILKNKLLKYQNTPVRRECHTPDKNYNNLKYNIGFTTYKRESKNNTTLLKQNIHRNISFIDHFKNNSKRFLPKSKSKNHNFNNLSNERKRVLTPDRMSKTRNIKFTKNKINFNKYGENKKINAPIHNFNFSQNKLSFSKSYGNHNSNSMENCDVLNNSLSRNILKEFKKKKNNFDKYVTKINNNNYYTNNMKFNPKLIKGGKLPELTSLSKEKLSKSFCSNNNYNESKNLLGRKNNCLFSNLNLNRVQKDFNKLYNQNCYSKVIQRSKSTDAKLIKKNNSNYLNQNKNYLKRNSKNKINPKLINNISYENIIRHNNTNNYNSKNQNNFYTTFNLSKKINNFDSSQKNNKTKYYENDNNLVFTKINNKENKGINLSGYNKNNISLKSNTFLEMAQQKIKSKKIINNKLNCVNNFITKSSTNTYDDINSSNSNVSRNNQILDSIEEIHFNFVNVVQSSRKLMKIQENLEAEKIINNNPNSTVFMVEERDIE